VPDVPVCIVPKRFAVDRAGECMHGDRAAEPDQGYLCLEFDHIGYPVEQQGESCIGDKRTDRDEEGLDESAGHLILYVSAGISESEITCFDDSDPGQVAEYFMPQFVQYHAGEGEWGD